MFDLGFIFGVLIFDFDWCGSNYDESCPIVIIWECQSIRLYT